VREEPLTAIVHTPEMEKRLARQAAAGDATAFTILFGAHRGEAYKIARAVTGEAESAKDALQDTFLKVY
jgi:DNA-directed RNA polymerase specialized sigma24 family protein